MLKRLIVIGFMVFAATGALGSDATHKALVNAVWLTGSGDFTVSTTDNYFSSCWLGGAVVATALAPDQTTDGLAAGRAQRDKIYAMLLAARTTAMEVTFFVDKDSNNNYCNIVGTML